MDWEESTKDPQCSKCTAPFVGSGNSIYITQIGSRRRDLCRSCVDLVLSFIDTRESGVSMPLMV